MLEIQTTHLFTLTISTATPLHVGTTPTGKRTAVLLTGGTFIGDRLRGVVENGGSDWITNRPDGSAELNVRVPLRTDDGELILVTYTGRRHATAEAALQLERGEEPDPRSLYLRVAVVFDTASEKYGWLNKIIAVGTGRRPPEGPVYEIYEVL